MVHTYIHTYDTCTTSIYMFILTFPYVVLALQPIVLQLLLLKHCQDLFESGE